MGIVKGQDGKTSSRKVAGLALIFVGIVALVVAQFQIVAPPSWTDLVRFVPGVFLVISGLVMFQIITVQNIQSIVSAGTAAKGA